MIIGQSKLCGFYGLFNHTFSILVSHIVNASKWSIGVFFKNNICNKTKRIEQIEVLKSKSSGGWEQLKTDSADRSFYFESQVATRSVIVEKRFELHIENNKFENDGFTFVFVFRIS